VNWGEDGIRNDPLCEENFKEKGNREESRIIVEEAA